MAEIHIKKKKKKPLWPWIIAILIIAAITWRYIDSRKEKKSKAISSIVSLNRTNKKNLNSNNQREKPANTISTNGNAENAPEVDKVKEFISFVNNKEVQNKIGADKETTSEGLIMLSDALAELSRGNNDLSTYVNKVHNDALNFDKNIESLKYAEIAWKTFKDAATAMEKIQEKKFTHTDKEVNQVKKAAQKIIPEQELIQQRKQVKNFFSQAALTINKMEQEYSS